MKSSNSQRKALNERNTVYITKKQNKHLPSQSTVAAFYPCTPLVSSQNTYKHLLNAKPYLKPKLQESQIKTLEVYV